MNKIVLYDQEDFLGESKQFVRNVPDLALKMFNDTAKSARVEGLHWVAYKDADYKGEFIIFAPGDYNTLGPNFRYKLSSLRLVEEELLNPEIVLYEDVDYKGEHRGVKKEANNLQRADFNNLVSSHQVKQGVWILHQGYNQTRARLITFKGDKWRSYFDYGWNDKLSSLRPLENSYTEVGASPSVRLEHTSCGM